MISALLILAFAKAASAQPIEIQADHFEMLLAERRTTYTGNVVATQGSRAISGQELVVKFNDDNQITAMRASGEPATLTDTAENPPISLSGTALHYDFDESVVRTEGDGVLSQGGDTIVAETIVYDLHEDRARAVGNEKQRVKLRLAPRRGNRKPD